MIKSLIHEKIKTYKVLPKNIENNQQIEKLKSLQNRLKWMIDDPKHNYSRLTNKLFNVQKNSKPYWSILKAFLNNKKVTIIPPLFLENEFVTDCKKKAEPFNSFFAKQYSLMSKDSKLPSRLHYFTEKRLSICKFSSNNIFDIIQQLDPHKAHSHDMISIRMLKICGKLN